jgi:hypothetical protein
MQRFDVGRLSASGGKLSWGCAAKTGRSQTAKSAMEIQLGVVARNYDSVWKKAPLGMAIAFDVGHLHFTIGGYRGMKGTSQVRKVIRPSQEESLLRRWSVGGTTLRHPKNSCQQPGEPMTQAFLRLLFVVQSAVR